MPNRDNKKTRMPVTQTSVQFHFTCWFLSSRPAKLVIGSLRVNPVWSAVHCVTNAIQTRFVVLRAVP
uniref:Uncharacterized protein n=1 Tax=Anguilla anguilla TaxID=7936 RepID=A0A0E9T312_ANGAN